MKKQLMMASILAFGMGIVQAQRPAPMQGGTEGPKSSGAQPSGTMQDRGSGGAATTMTGTADQTAAPQSFKGCLTQSSGGWTLAADNGQTLRISGSDNQLSSYGNQQVNIQGTEATDGTVKVASIDKISDSCNATGQAASSTQQGNTITQPSTSSTTSRPPSDSSSSTASQSNTNTEQMSNSAGAASSASGQSTTGTQGRAGSTASNPATTTPPVTEQTPANTVGGNASDQGAAQNPPETTTGQRATAGSEQNANVPHISDMDNTQAAGKRLPQTASPLPLLGLIGLGSLLTGLMARRRK